MGNFWTGIGSKFDGTELDKDFLSFAQERLRNPQQSHNVDLSGNGLRLDEDLSESSSNNDVSIVLVNDSSTNPNVNHMQTLTKEVFVNYFGIKFNKNELL